MEDDYENKVILFKAEKVMFKNSSDINNSDLVNNMGVLSVVNYKSDLGKCIDWNQCDVSIDNDDQEWAIVNNSKYEFSNGISKAPRLQIQLKYLKKFDISKHHSDITFYQEGMEPITFTFHHNDDFKFDEFVQILINLDNAEIKTVKPSRFYPELSVIKNDRRNDNLYETTLSHFGKITYMIQFVKDVKFRAGGIVHPTSNTVTDHICDSKNTTDGYEIVISPPPLPPRVLPSRSSPLTESEWNSFQDENGRISDPQSVKKKIFHGGISPDLRCIVWKFLLDYYPWDSTSSERLQLKLQKKEEYFTMKSQWKTLSSVQEENFSDFKERKSLIEKDVYRTDRVMPYFAGDNNANLQKLRDILMTYIMYNFDFGYIQGMSDLLSPLLVQLTDEADTFWCFVGFMNKVYHNFDFESTGMKKQLQQLYCLLTYIEPDLAGHLENQDSTNMAFCFRWLLIWFKREFNFDEIYLLWEILWTETLCKNFQLLIAVAILDTEKNSILSKNGFAEILKHINELSNKIDLEKILRKAEAIYHQLCAAAKIPSQVREIIGLEPVLEEEKTGNENNCKEELTFCDNSERKQNGSGIAHIFSDSQETVFDNSINFNYL